MSVSEYGDISLLVAEEGSMEGVIEKLQEILGDRLPGDWTEECGLKIYIGGQE